MFGDPKNERSKEHPICSKTVAGSRAMSRKKHKPRRDLATKEDCAEICRLAQILGNRCKASGIDASKIPITCKKVIESHYILADDGSYIRRYGGRKKL
jgi:hypothetical protein